MPSQDRPAHPHPKLHGRKKGHRLRKQRQELLDTLLPRIVFPQTASPIHNPQDLFHRRYDALWLEVGFGDGGHLAWQAKNNPDIGFIGCEPYEPGVAGLLSLIAADNIENVVVHPDDARQVFSRLPEGCISRVFILFPDPWPKKKHNKRRFISPENIDALARLMHSGAELRFASDIDDYIQWTLAIFRDRKDFIWTAESPRDWQYRPDDWPATKYERKANAAGRTGKFLRFQRV